MEDIENLISSIVTVPIDDGVKFQLKSIWRLWMKQSIQVLVSA